MRSEESNLTEKLLIGNLKNEFELLDEYTREKNAVDNVCCTLVLCLCAGQWEVCCLEGSPRHTAVLSSAGHTNRTMS